MSNLKTPRDGTPDGPVDPQDTETLVAFALGQLAGDEAASVRTSIESDPAIAGEFDSIRSHLDLHAETREIQPAPGGFARLQQRLEAEPANESLRPEPRGFFQRYWLSVAAAALLLVAVFFPRAQPSSDDLSAVEISSIGGHAVRDVEGNWNSDGVCRIAYGDGVTITMDVETTVVPLHAQRLALEAGRIFVDVEPGRKGFTVEVGAGRIVTLGTSFLVEHRGTFEGRVAVERGHVVLVLEGTRNEVAAGTEMRWTETRRAGNSVVAGSRAARPVPTGAHLRWFEIPSLSAKILDDRTVVVVIRNEMIDPIKLAPPTGGEPLFYATVGKHSYPHEPANFGRNVVLAPGTDFTFEMKLPQAIEPDQSVVIRCPTLGLDAEARRETGR